MRKKEIVVPAVLAILGLMLPLQLTAQKGVWASWDEAVVRSLSTASAVGTLNEEEKKVILFINMARHDGPLFASTFLDAYMAEKNLGKNSYVRSLYRDLKKTAGLPPLEPEPDLISAARSHALDTGESGRTGHLDFKKRFEPLLGNPYSLVAENLAYGHAEAIDIVISLLIDDGIRDLGHRRNMLNPQFNTAGVAIRPHRSYRVSCVIDFGSRSRSELNQVPYH
jgi:uncharacterized protein YkwD